MRRIGLLLLAAVVAGCAGQPLKRELSGLIGRNIHDAVDILGTPDGRRELTEGSVYTWSTNRNVVLFETTSAPGMAGSTPVYGTVSSSGGPVNGTTTPTSTTYVPMTYRCTVQIAIDKSGTINRYDVEGDHDSCQSYARRFH